MKKLRFEASAGIWGQFGWVRVSIFRYFWCVLDECVTRIRWTNEKLPNFDEAIILKEKRDKIKNERMQNV